MFEFELISEEKKMLVNAIQNGLLDSKRERESNQTITNNRKHMSKWDFVNTNVSKTLEYNERFCIIPLDRGLFEPIMIFDRKTKNLYTIMKVKNFEKVLSRQEITKCHYMDAMLDNNLPYKTNPNQLSLLEANDMFSEKAEQQIDELSTNIKTMFHTDIISKYYTIVVDFSGYILTSVEIYFCSKWLEILENESWNDFILPSYEIVGEPDNVLYNKENELKSKIQIKPAVKRKFGLA